MQVLHLNLLGLRLRGVDRILLLVVLELIGQNLVCIVLLRHLRPVRFRADGFLKCRNQVIQLRERLGFPLGQDGFFLLKHTSTFSCLGGLAGIVRLPQIRVPNLLGRKEFAVDLDGRLVAGLIVDVLIALGQFALVIINPGLDLVLRVFVLRRARVGCLECGPVLNHRGLRLLLGGSGTFCPGRRCLLAENTGSLGNGGVSLRAICLQKGQALANGNHFGFLNASHSALSFFCCQLNQTTDGSAERGDGLHGFLLVGL